MKKLLSFIVVVGAIALMGLYFLPEINKQYPLRPKINVYNNTDILTFAEKVTPLIFQYDYHNIRDHIFQDKVLFTHKGWKSFAEAFNRSGNIETIVKSKGSVTARVGGPVSLDDHGGVGPYETWTVKVPMLVTYKTQAPKATSTHAYSVTLKIKVLSFDEQKSSYEDAVPFSQLHVVGIDQVIARDFG